MGIITRNMREYIYHRDNYTCKKCGIYIPQGMKTMPNPDNKLWLLEIDHIVPISQGGDEDESNLQVLCNRCNCRKNFMANSPFMTGKEIKYNKFL